MNPFQLIPQQIINKVHWAAGGAAVVLLLLIFGYLWLFHPLAVR